MSLKENIADPTWVQSTISNNIWFVLIFVVYNMLYRKKFLKGDINSGVPEALSWTLQNLDTMLPEFKTL